VRLLRQVLEQLPVTTTAQFLGDAELDSLELQPALDACDWTALRVCRTAKNTRVQVDGEWVRSSGGWIVASIDVHPGRKKMWRAVPQPDRPRASLPLLPKADVDRNVVLGPEKPGFHLHQGYGTDPWRLSRLPALAPRLSLRGSAIAGVATCLAYW
jgi:hypothetical protein